jgi:putative signal transducing protein
VGGVAKQTHLRVGYALVGLAFAVAVVGGRVFRHGLQWVIAAVLLWAGLTLVGRARGWRRKRRLPHTVSAPTRRRFSPLKPGEAYQDAVKLALVPNVPLAEVWCQRLRQSGIEAFYKGASPYVGGAGGLADLNQALPAEIWVGEDDAARALQLFPELRS